MRNIKLTIEYDGTNYSGWQCQKSKVQSKKSKVKTIQETIEKALQRILGEKIKVIGSGRTDAGVHAFGQVANFKTTSGIKLDKLLVGLNGLLPEDIKVTCVGEIYIDFHSRFDAKEKLYRYTVLNRKSASPFFSRTSYFYPHKLNLRRMQKEARFLLGKHNFTSFCASNGRGRNPVKTIKKLTVRREGETICFDIAADGFLYNMVRNIVGTLLDAGRGRLEEGTLKRILLAKDRRLAGTTAAAKGLCLMKVKY